MDLIKETPLRSRFALFVSSVGTQKQSKRRRCTEPSRLPVKQMKRFLKKRKLRKRFRNYVLKNVPKTSALYQIIRAPLLRKAVAFANGKTIREVNELTVTEKCPLRNGCQMSSRNNMVYKNVNHRINNIISKLSGDIETNPGPFFVESSKTIRAPYSQGNTSVFGNNSGKQCVAMSLAAILFNFIYSVRSSSDLVEIMNVGNELYTRLSLSAGQDLLMLKELPEVLYLRETMYRLQYSDSYFGTVHNINECAIEDINCLPLIEAFDLLIGENFKSFILTITICTVAILITRDGKFKVFDSHSRDSEGMFDPCGTCVLVEIDSLNQLVQYFENLYVSVKDALYELKGVEVVLTEETSVGVTMPEICVPVNIENLNKTEIGSVNVQDSDTCCSCKQCCFISFYAICFSVLKQISYWNENTLHAIIENGKQLQEKLMLKEHSTVFDLPNSLAIDVENIEARFNVLYKGNKREQESFLIQEMKKVIAENQEHNTGFLMSAFKYYVCCIFKRDCKGQTRYAVFGLDNRKSKGYVYELVQNITSAIELLLRVITEKTTGAKAFEIQFIKCNCELSKEDRQKVLRRHMSVKQKRKLAKERRENYAAMEPAKKRACLDSYVAKYANMDTNKKKALSVRKAEKHRLMESNKKRDLSVRKAAKYRLMEPNKKRELNVQKATKYRLMDPHEKRALNVQKAKKYRLMDPHEKRALNVQKAKKYRLMDPHEKRALNVQKAKKYRLMDPHEKRALNVQKAKKYRLMDPHEKRALRVQNAEKYRQMDSGKKKDLIKKIVTRQKVLEREKKIIHTFTRLLY
ncbi:uncharacterized protein LOC144658810 [Oculina patagonica]